MPEGKNSPCEFSLAAAEVEELADDPDMAIGLDPSAAILTSFHKHRNGLEAPFLDVSEVDMWWQALASGTLPCNSVMASASSDTVRLAILNRS